MLVHVYLVEGQYESKCYILLREDDYITSYHFLEIPKFAVAIKYSRVPDHTGMFLPNDKSIVLLDTIPEEEVSEYLQFRAMMGIDCP